ncbi:MAG: DUF2914 domain-containing protein [Desulfuromonas sp.]|nr:MAG: DUF2914 domain-containing protein [Desulfuromonas sp.]
MLKNFLLVLLFAGACTVQAAELQVVESTITSTIENQRPLDHVETYPADYGKLYCFTRITGGEAGSSVTHVWYYRSNEMARVVLPVGSSDWRTYSSKRFLPQWAGDWKVVILDDDEHELASVPFRLE